MSEKNFHIPSLDGIRALAIMIVFFAHAGLGHVVPGGFGVTVFFFLSGYLITTLLRREYEKYGEISLRKFYLRRVYRIFPPLYIVLILGIVLAFAMGEAASMKFWPVASQFLHTTNYYTSFNGEAELVPHTAVLWSLAVEEHFYLVFPLLLITLARKNPLDKVGRILIAGCVLVLAWRYILVIGLDIGFPYTYRASETRMDSILFGCIMGLWRNPILDGDAFRSNGQRILALGAAACLLLFTFVYRDETFRETLRYTLQGIALWPVFYLAISCYHWPLFKWLDWAPMRVIGILSYTMYLVHQACLHVAETFLSGHGPTLLSGVAGFALTIAISAAMYVGIEKRMGDLRKKMHDA